MKQLIQNMQIQDENKNFFTISESLRTKSCDESIKSRIIEELTYLEDHYLRKAAFSILDILGNWYYICPGTRPESIGVIHHTHSGGLAYHHLGVFRLCRSIGQSRYENGQIDQSLLEFCALFHDVGKYFEYSDTQKTPYTGLGHTVLALIFIPNILIHTNISVERVQAACHILASHHERVNEGALTVPETPEAAILASADRLDAKLWMLS